MASLEQSRGCDEVAEWLSRLRRVERMIWLGEGIWDRGSGEGVRVDSEESRKSDVSVAANEVEVE